MNKGGGMAKDPNEKYVIIFVPILILQVIFIISMIFFNFIYAKEIAWILIPYLLFVLFIIFPMTIRESVKTEKKGKIMIFLILFGLGIVLIFINVQLILSGTWINSTIDNKVGIFVLLPLIIVNCFLHGLAFTDFKFIQNLRYTWCVENNDTKEN